MTAEGHSMMTLYILWFPNYKIQYCVSKNALAEKFFFFTVRDIFKPENHKKKLKYKRTVYIANQSYAISNPTTAADQHLSIGIAYASTTFVQHTSNRFLTSDKSVLHIRQITLHKQGR